MRDFVKRALIGAALTVLLGSVALVGPVGAAGPVYEEAGVLRLHLGADDDNLRFDPVTGDDVYQYLDPASSTSCVLTSTGANLVVFNSSGTRASTPGIKDHRIGVGQKGEGNGEPCARINKDLGQKLTLTLGPALAGKKIAYAEIDLGFKYDGVATITLKDGAVPVATQTVACSGSDCGPDSGGNDNLRVSVGTRFPTGDPVLFDTIVIEASLPSNGAVSLEGGFAGASPGPLGTELGTNDTLFQLVEPFDGELNCGDTVTVQNGDVIGTFTRLDNADGTTCNLKPYRLNITTGTTGPVVSFLPQGSDAAVYRAFITFGPYTPANPTLADIEYDQDGAGPGPFEPMQWCSDPVFDVDGKVTSAELPGTETETETWCIASEETRGSGDSIVTTWQLYGEDDPNFK